MLVEDVFSFTWTISDVDYIVEELQSQGWFLCAELEIHMQCWGYSGYDYLVRSH